MSRQSFNHGTTRQWAIDQFAGPADVVVFLTQDAVLAEPSALQALVAALDDPQAAAAYGRQLPHPDATPVAAALEAQGLKALATKTDIADEASVQALVEANGALQVANETTNWQLVNVLMRDKYSEGVALGILDDARMAAE